MQDQEVHSRHVPARPTLTCIAAMALLLALAACSQFRDTRKPPPDNTLHAQLSIGYSLLYQEADGIPKLKWLLMFKEKHAEMGQVTSELIDFYQQLASSMQKLSRQHPLMRIDLVPMSEIEGAERKAIGEDLAREFAPLAGKTGVEFEREALLMFYNSLNEQRHLTAVMVGMETDPALRKFLQTTNSQLDAHYAKVGALLNRRYFTH